MKLRSLAVAIFGMAFFAPQSSARVLHVDYTLICPDPTVCTCPGADGNCFRFIRISDAVSNAAAGDSILVRGGKYAESVALKNGVVLLGGYDATFTTRDPATNPTLIYGNLQAAAVTSGTNVTSTAVLDGFVLSGGGGSPGAGLVINGGGPTIQNNTVSGNLLSGVAGGVYISGGSTAKLIGNQIVDNTTQGSGGGIHIFSSSPTLENNTISRNTAGNSGGGVYIVEGSPILLGNTISDNLARDGSGGGVYVQAGTDLDIQNNTLRDNVGSYGGGIFFRDESTATLKTNTLEGNSARISGGGVAMITFSEITLQSNVFTNCSADSLSGGGVFAYQSEITILGDDPVVPSPDALFSGCTAERNGGGVYAFDSDGVLSGLRFRNCTADSSGGGCFLGLGLYTVSENIVEDCNALEGGGIGIWYSGSGSLPLSPVLSNTIYGCRSTGGENFGGGMTVFGNSLTPVAQLAGNLISHTRMGSALLCRRAIPGPALTAKPLIGCSTFHLGPENTTPQGDTVGGTNCQDSFGSDESNRIGDPLYCLGSLQLQNCSPDVNNSCPPAGTNADNRGATQLECACGIFSVEAKSWGEIKALYR